jgi:hypothetical protein
MRKAIGIALLLAAASACEFDNFAPPQSQLTGRVVHEGETVHVRQNAVELELWQDGYELNEAIPLHVHQDGTFAALLFDGAYKLARKRDNGPWMNDPDTMRIELRGSLTLDVPVEPYFLIENASIAREGSVLTGTFAVRQIVADRSVERIALYVGTTRFVDSRYNALRVERAIGNEALLDVNSLTVDLSGLGGGGAPLFGRRAKVARPRGR